MVVENHDRNIKNVCFFLYLINYLTFCLINVNQVTKYNVSIELFLIIWGQILIFGMFGLDIISVLSTLTVSMLAPSAIFFYLGIGNGDISLGLVPINLHADIVNLYAYVFWGVLFSYLLDIKKYEKLMSMEPLIFSNQSVTLFNNLVALAFSIVAFPTFPTLSSSAVNLDRFQMLLPGHAWNQLVIVALLFNLPKIKQKGVLFTYLIVSVWFLAHGERADITGLVIGILIYVGMRNRLSVSKKISLFFGGALIFILLLIVGYERIEYKLPNMAELFENIATFSTLSDVSYLVNVSIDYVEKFGHTNGAILFSTIKSAIPLITVDNSFGSFIEQVFPNPGGEPIISGPLIDFGILGVSISAIVDALLFSFIVKRNSLLFRYEFLVLLCSIPRIVWYGRSFVFTSLIFFVPFMYFINTRIVKLSTISTIRK